MALERSASLLRAEWSRENDWARARLRGDAGAGVRLDTTRGIDLNAGAFARASLDAGVRKFLAASVTGSLQAQATLQAQLQLPINLFREAGVAVRLQARAEAAATIGVALGLSVGDFLDCLDAEFGSDGVAAALGRLVLEESVLEGGALASYSVSVMAYANAAMTVRLLEGASAEPGQQPGFTIFAEAGAGFEVGEGVRYGL